MTDTQETPKKLLLSEKKNIYTTVSDEDYAWASQFKWSASLCANKGNYYAMRVVTTNKKRKSLKLHREISKCPSGMVVDHINGDTLDNRRENLRIVTHQENMSNQTKRKGSSQYRGVTFKKDRQRWVAQIQVNGMRTYLGAFETEEEAAKAFLTAAEVHYGKYGTR